MRIDLSIIYSNGSDSNPTENQHVFCHSPRDRFNNKHLHLLTIRGEELGLPEVVDIPAEKRQDPTFFRHKGAVIGRDGCRVPIPWSSTSGPSFGYSPSDATAEPHLPMPEWFGEYAPDVQKEGSTLDMYTQALKLRRELQAEEKLQWVGEEEGVIRYRRPGGWEVVFNLSNDGQVEVNGDVLIASGEVKDGKVRKDVAVWSRVQE